MSIHSRKYDPDPDFLRVRDFLIETFGITQQPFNWTLERWDYCRYFVVAGRPHGVADWEDHIHLWEKDGQIVGVACSEGKVGEVYLQVQPDHRDLENEMIAWSEEHLAAQKGDGGRRLSVPTYDYDSIRQEMLQRRGYEHGELVGHRYRRSLEGPLQEPDVAESYQLRSLREDDDLSERALALGRAFGSRPPEIGVYRTLQSAPGYQLNLDLVIEAQDGSFAAVAIAWYDETNRIGMFEPVGTVQEHRRKGLGRAIMHEGFRLLRDQGAKAAYVGTGTGAGANALFRSVGFDEDFPDHAWTKVF